MGSNSIDSESSAELLQAEADIIRHSVGYLTSIALQCAVKLRIPDAIHRCGDSASMAELLAALAVPIPPAKQPYLWRLMKVLAMQGVFVAKGGDGDVYQLNTMSRLLLDDERGIWPGVLLATTPQFMGSAMRIGEWFTSEEDVEVTAFIMANGQNPHDTGGVDAEFNSIFNKTMAADSRFVADLVVRQCAEVFKGIGSLVDVAGGTGTMARAIAKAFPHVKCSVLDLAHVIQEISPEADNNNNVEFIAGDMMEFIPPADVILLKYVLHNWTDEDSVKILKRCREAVISHAGNGKVIIIDAVVGTPSPGLDLLQTQLLMDMEMMSLFMAKERYEHEWSKIIKEAGFTNYKIQPILGLRSVIELYI